MNMPDKLTIRDIAKMAGVSPTVVSFVINGKDGVNIHTREKVLEIVKNTGFKPNLSSRRLTLKKSFNIGVSFVSAASPFNSLFYFEIMQGILEKSKDYGYNIVFSGIEKANSKEYLPDVIEKGDADGMLFLMDVEKMVLDALSERNIPTVLIDYHGTAAGIPCVNVDYKRSAYVATKYLIEHGHRDIAFLSQNIVPIFYNQVFTGFSQALEEANIMIPLNWVCAANNETETVAAMKKLLYGPKCPTAVFCSVDKLAIVAMSYVKTQGGCIPEDISFIGIDDILISKYVDPSLTSMHIDKYEMGIRAMDLIMKIINGQQAENVIIQSDHIISRNSVFTIPR